MALALFQRVRPGLNNYRALLLLQCAHIIGIPITMTLVALSVTGIYSRMTLAFRLGVTVASVPLFATARILLDDFLQRRAAQSRGAILVPRVKGKWPGNLDVMLYIAKEFETGYVLQSYKNLLDQYGVKTLNLRLLWSDVVRSKSSVLPLALTPTSDHHDG